MPNHLNSAQDVGARHASLEFALRLGDGRNAMAVQRDAEIFYAFLIGDPVKEAPADPLSR